MDLNLGNKIHKEGINTNLNKLAPLIQTDVERLDFFSKLLKEKNRHEGECICANQKLFFSLEHIENWVSLQGKKKQEKGSPLGKKCTAD